MTPTPEANRRSPLIGRGRRRRILIGFAIATAVIAAVLIGALLALPGWLRGKVERIVLETSGRELTAGSLDLSLSLPPTIVATRVSFANAPWGSEPQMVRADRIALSLDLASLWSPPLKITSLELDGVRILLESDASGRENWKIQTGKPPSPSLAERPPVVFGRAEIRGFELVRRTAIGAPDLRVGVSHLDARLDPGSGMVDLDAAGHLNDAPFDVAGQIGTFERVYQMRDVDHAVTGHIGSSRVTLRGRLRDPLALGGPNVEAEIDGPDIANALANFGLRAPLSGPFRLHGRASSSTEGVDLDLGAEFAGAAAAVQGRVRTLLDAGPFEAVVRVSGPDAASTGAAFGVEHVPPGPFEISGRCRRDGRMLSIANGKLRAGGTSAMLRGTLGPLPELDNSRLELAVSGKDLSELSELTGLRLPAGSFSARGTLARGHDTLVLEPIEVSSQGGVIRARGSMGTAPPLESLDLDVEASGPDLSPFSGIATVSLPREPFAITGHVVRRGKDLDLDAVHAALGGNTVDLDGEIALAPKLVGTDLHVRAAGPDLSRAAELVGAKGLPAEPFAVSGHVGFVKDGYDVEGVEARVGTISASVAGRLGAGPLQDGTVLDVRVMGDSLSSLSRWGVPIELPGDRFDVAGRLSVARRAYRVERVVAQVGDDRAVVDGALGALPDVSSLDVGFELSGPMLSEVGRFWKAMGREPPARLPSEAYTATGHARRIETGVELAGTRVTIGDAEVRVDGTIATGERLIGTDLRFEASAPDASLPSAWIGVQFPEGPIGLHGRLERIDAGLRFDEVEAWVGAARATVSGLLRDAPKRAGTEFDVHFAGPDLAASLGSITGLSILPTDPFELAAKVERTDEGVALPDFRVRLGENDLEGSASVRRGERLFVEADLRSKRLGRRSAPVETAAPPDTRSKKKRGHVISDEPLVLDSLRQVDGRVRLAVDELVFPAAPLRAFVVEGTLQNGALHLDRIEGTGRLGGKASASLSLDPVDEGYRIEASGMLSGGKLDLPSKGETLTDLPPLDAEFSVKGQGRSLHEIAASGKGSALITLGSGRIPNYLTEFMTSDVLISLLDALNPFRKSSSETVIECGVVGASLESGKASVEPIAARTDKMTVIGRGKVDFDTEDINLVWTLKSRKGIGVSAASIANPYIKLGGTLAAPSLDAKPLEAAASTGAAVATGGLTLLFRGLYDRITAEGKVCVRALEKARKNQGPH